MNDETFKRGDRVTTPRGPGSVWMSFGKFVDVDLDDEFKVDNKTYRSWLFYTKADKVTYETN